VTRSAITSDNIDVAAASGEAGVLVTHAEAGFIKSVVELTVDPGRSFRGITRAATEYHAGRMPEFKVGRQLSVARSASSATDRSRAILHRSWPPWA